MPLGGQARVRRALPVGWKSGSGGFALSAAQVDMHIKAVVTAAMYDISRVSRNGWQDSRSDDERRAMLDGLAAQRWRDLDAGEPRLSPTFPTEIPATGLESITSEFFEYYAADRGHHPQPVGGFTITSALAHPAPGSCGTCTTSLPGPSCSSPATWRTRGTSATPATRRRRDPRSRWRSRGARHIDLHDRTELIPFDRLEKFFADNTA